MVIFSIKRRLFMKKILIILLGLALFLSFGCGKNSDITSPSNEVPIMSVQQGEVIEGSYIVVFEENKVSRGRERVGKFAEKITGKYGINFNNKKKFVYGYSVRGFSAKLTIDEVNKLKEDQAVKFIEKDRVIKLNGDGAGGGGRPGDEDPDDPEDPSAEQTPWGINRVNGGIDATGKVAWIIDSGIDQDNLDLNVDTSRSVSFVDTESTPDDLNGHGTHVAGTIAAIDNNIGVIGVAANATVVAVKVLDSRGSGSITSVVAGIDYYAQNSNSGDVANMSLGGGISDTIDNAITNAADQGNIFALAAGNESDDANNHSPARVEHYNVYTISAIDSSDVFASFSNYGNPPIEYAEPGVNILSLAPNNGTATMSGTSMASPHCAGLLLLGNISTDGYAVSDPDGNPDPIGVH